jgi:hypothetical protein
MAKGASKSAGRMLKCPEVAGEYRRIGTRVISRGATSTGDSGQAAPLGSRPMPGLVERPVLGNGHAGCGRRPGETHRWKHRQGAPGRPHYYLLEDEFEVQLLNAAHMHNVPGRKTDVSDAAWIAQLVEHGLVRPSFVPPPPIRRLRDLTRYRSALTGERTREKQRLEKVLEDAGIKLSAAVFVAEIGDIARFDRAARLASWAGLTPKHHESDTTVHRGQITKQGSRLVRWAAVEAVQRVPVHTRLGAVREQVGARRGRNIGVVAAARQLTELVFYGLRDEQIRHLALPPRPAAA